MIKKNIGIMQEELKIQRTGPRIEENVFLSSRIAVEAKKE